MKQSRIYRYIRCALIAAGMLFPTLTHAQELRHLSDEARIFIVTCGPGEALYARFGHTAVMVIDDEQGISEVYNYGIFDFNTQHFYWRFVRGETYYQLGKEDAQWFMRAYSQGGRQVNIQELHLSPEHRDAYCHALQVNYLPENRVYLYNFVFDNCATRPYNLLMAVLPEMSSTYTGAEGMTYRKFIQRYIPKGSWADLGINMLFGLKADEPMHGEQRLFLPEELMFYLSETRYPDGTPLVEAEHIEPFAIERVPWYKTWYFGLALLFAVIAFISYRDRQRLKRTRWVDYAMYAVYAVVLLLVVFLTFFSIHPLVGFGPYLLIIPSIHLCARIIYRWR